MRKFALLLAVLTRLSSAAEIDPASLSEARITTIELPTSGAPGKTWQAGTIIAAPMPKLCALIQDYASYPTFMPNMAKAVIIKADADGTQADFTLSLPLGKTKQYRLQMSPAVNAQSCRLAWKMLPRPDLKPDQTIADTRGYWLLTPLPADPAKTVLRYQVYSDPGSVPVGLGWIVDMLGKDSLPKTLEAVRNQVKSRV
ncbi:SRPBCC family protein [Uliginosibacterium sp. 31-16]|uniref:SRPBCC family protein n=1 Tax=Uliginosibacterium sp. 31-16 TaxID=3068315 RepID=UPI00273D9EA3|nr:SRPBCC family protein [Uliginosibacterium sp. 31-16]MDP5239379.1 SRPBCC family protein [Uliginosibacterium sp. 31-16]